MLDFDGVDQGTERNLQLGGIDDFTSPYDLSLLDELSNYVCAWKVGSGDITWPQIIEAMASRHLPI